MLPLNPLKIISARGWLIIGSCLLSLFLIFAAARSCQDQRNDAVVTKITASLEEGRTQSGQEAISTIGKVGERATETDDLTRTNRDAILSAPGAQENVDPALDDAGRRAICLRTSARSSPACQRLLNARP